MRPEPLDDSAAGVPRNGGRIRLEGEFLRPAFGERTLAIVDERALLYVTGGPSWLNADIESGVFCDQAWLDLDVLAEAPGFDQDLTPFFDRRSAGAGSSPP